MTLRANRVLVDRMRQAADPQRAAAMAAYMRGQFPFLGIASPQVRLLMRENPLPKPAEVEPGQVALDLWQLPEREFQYVACVHLRRYVKFCEPAFIDVAKHLVVTKPWWDTVDTLASHTVGPLVRANPELVATMDSWIDDENMWLARTALLHQLGYKAATDSVRLFGYCRRRANHPDFFIRKAIGWALREYAKTDPEAVRVFVHANEGTLSGLSKREALKNL
jgi:3-methyladenine DNA glycosylase AlkD